MSSIGQIFEVSLSLRESYPSLPTFSSFSLLLALEKFSYLLFYRIEDEFTSIFLKLSCIYYYGLYAVCMRECRWPCAVADRGKGTPGELVLSFHYGFWGANSGLQACSAGIFPTEPSTCPALLHINYISKRMLLFSCHSVEDILTLVGIDILHGGSFGEMGF